MDIVRVGSLLNAFRCFRVITFVHWLTEFFGNWFLVWERKLFPKFLQTSAILHWRMMTRENVLVDVFLRRKAFFLLFIWAPICIATEGGADVRMCGNSFPLINELTVHNPPKFRTRNSSCTVTYITATVVRLKSDFYSTQNTSPTRKLPKFTQVTWTW